MQRLVVVISGLFITVSNVFAAETLLLDGWRFHRGALEGAEAKAFDDSNWERVRIPHDWAIEGPFAKTHDLQRVAVVQDGDKVPVASTGRTGGLPWLGEGWYRREITIPKDAGFAELVFDGAMAEPWVFVDGKEVGYWANGYAMFAIDISAFIGTTPDDRHVVAVHLDNQPESSRWYPGAGLYRPVRLRLGEKTGLVTWGTSFRTDELSDSRAKVSFSSEVRVPSVRRRSPGERIEVCWRLRNPEGAVAASARATVGAAASAGNGAPAVVSATAELVAPKRWTPETPFLYELETSVRCGDRTVDVRREKVGIRTVAVDKGGFKLNGVRRDFRGVCLHHDLGPLGAAFNKSAFRRQVRLLKEMGCDAIRTSHNLPPAWQTEICDEMGMMVMAESFDMWLRPKCRNGYCRFFFGWWEKDLANLIRCHRNRPSVVMWSIGNEVPDQSDPEAIKYCFLLQDFCHRMDPTRPVTQGLDRVRDAIDNGFVAMMDIPGINYRLSFYDEVWTNSTPGVVLGAETASTVSSRGVYKFPVTEEKDRLYDDGHLSSYDVGSCSWSNLPDDDWALQEDRTWTIGEFVWTGFDYLGEPTPYKEYWPSRSSYFGIFDLAGLPKDRYWLYRSHWNRTSPTLHLLPHWTWPGREGQVTPVYCYTTYHAAELFVNGKSQGRRTFNRDSRLDRYRLRWNDVVYEPGEIKVVAFDKDGRAVAEKTVRTAGNPHHLEISADRTRLAPRDDQDTPDLAFVTVRIVDKDGNLCPDADLRLRFSASGSVAYKAACNGDATSLEVFHSMTMKAFHGELVAVVEPTGIGSGRFEVVADGLPVSVCGFEVSSGEESVASEHPRVRLVDCPKCPKRIRISADGKLAFVNCSRVESGCEAGMVARAVRLLERAERPLPAPALTPLMGWSSWNTFGCDISEKVLLDVARAMATNGLKQAGYRYVNLDDGFFAGHDEKGRLRFHPKRFPNGLKGTVDGIHALGLKAGIYSDAGADTCGSIWMGDSWGKGAGLYGHDADDCRLLFGELGFDFFKVDYCGGKALKLDERMRYTEIARAISAAGRNDVRLNICRWAFPGTWAASLAGSWRTTRDIRANWNSIRNILAENLYLSAYASPGHFNDLDMLEVGQRKGATATVFGREDSGLTEDEEIAHFGMWCLLSSPLVLGNDVRRMSEDSLRLVTNPYLVRMNQDPLGQQAYVACRQGSAYLLVKDADEVNGRSRYVGVYNAGDSEAEFELRAHDIDLDGRIAAFDLLERADVGEFDGRMSVCVPSHAARFYLLEAERRKDRQVYEAETALLSDYSELGASTFGTNEEHYDCGRAFPDEVDGAFGGVAVVNLGVRPSNDLVWPRVNVSSNGEFNLVIRCRAARRGAFDVQVDGKHVGRVEVQGTDGKFVDRVVRCSLEAGDHSIRLSGTDLPFPDIDRMSVLR